jgi:hypothetical protein
MAWKRKKSQITTSRDRFCGDTEIREKARWQSYRAFFILGGNCAFLLGVLAKSDVLTWFFDGEFVVESW